MSDTTQGTAAAAAREQTISSVRSFSRFYTRLLGILDEHMLNSDYTLTEIRVLHELAHADHATATRLINQLGLDPGYLSRILKRFENQGLLVRESSRNDARVVLLALTAAGRALFEPLDEASQKQVRHLLAPLGEHDLKRLEFALATAKALLNKQPFDSTYIIRERRSGDLGWVVHRHGALFAEEYGYDERFEALVAQIVSDFVRNFDARKENCWIAERQGEVAGSVFLMQDSPEVAKLRLLYVEPSARGLGIGSHLVGEALSFARAHSYKTVRLWTNSILGSARRIYEAEGFKLIEEAEHNDFGDRLVGQTWELAIE